ncbi:hypothetical protein NP493_453g01010 [Ridgeia piscesae]|uniref:Uncharacterized protein n=1 Tax=Ridgeia piscesae TaxID=27915 RepID=A0AAD9NTK8_RIDPI|nr:hypothetical protein NP493_453g01010 [Ridgeia piscesae]
MVVIWNTDRASTRGQVSVMAKAHTDVDIVRMRIAAFDDTRMVSCGRDNVRLWRVKDGTLRSAPVNLLEYHSMEFTDCCFEAGYEATRDPLDRIDYRKVTIQHVRRLLPVNASSKKEKQTFNSEDGFLRLWPLDFKHVYLEAEHEGPVSAVDISSDGMRILAGTSVGNIGILDVSSRGYTTVMRSHTAHILAMSIDPIRRHLATVAEDHTIRVWDVDTMQQHRGKVIGVAFSVDGRYLYSAGSLGSIALYDASNARFQLLRLLGNTIVRGESHGPNALAVSPDGKCVAFVGPTEFTVTVVDGRTLDEVLRIDITSVRGCGDGGGIDTATQIKYAHYDTKTLLVTTSSNKLLKFHARNGSLVSEVFIGHSENISSVMFSPDGLSVISSGEAIFLWDFLASPMSSRHTANNSLEGRQKVTNYYTGEDEEYLPYKSAVPYTERKSFSENPRGMAPQPTSHFDPDCLVGDISDIQRDGGGCVSDIQGNGGGCVSDIQGGGCGCVTDIQGDGVGCVSDIQGDGGGCVSDIQGDGGGFALVTSRGMEVGVLVTFRRMEGADVVKVQEEHRGIVGKELGKKHHVTATSPPRCKTLNPPRPTAHKHFEQKVKNHALAQRRYAPPPNQAGLKLKSVIGYNGNGRGNMVWHPDTGHSEEVSTLALQHDSTMLASASGSFGISSSQICLWCLEDMYCAKVLVHHEFDVVCMAYSRDDRFLVSVGDYRDCTIAVWSTHTYDLLTTTKTSEPVHDLKWDPTTANEFASVGDNGTLLFWLLDETQINVTLNVHQADVPDDLLQKHHMTGGDDVSLYMSVVVIDGGDGQSTGGDDVSLYVSVVDVDRRVGMTSDCTCPLLLKTGGDDACLYVSVAIKDRRDDTGGDEVSLTCLEYGTDSSLYVASSNGKAHCGTSTGRRGLASDSCQDTSVSAFFASCADDGSLRVWSVKEREQTLQFQVMNQSCNCLAFCPVIVEPGCRTTNTLSNLDAAPVVATKQQEEKLRLPNIVAGYSDGTVRMFDLGKVEMALKMHPHATAVTAISFSSDGRMILSGSSDGLIAIGSATTGMTVRVINDHKGAPITCIDVSKLSPDNLETISSPELWLASSADRRVSVWSADWSKDFCELIDWLTFPAPAFTPDGTAIRQGDNSYFQQVPPSLVQFSLEEPDTVILRTVKLSHWATSMDMCPGSPLFAIGNSERLLKLIDYYEGSFQDFVGHNDSVQLVKFSSDGSLFFSAAHAEILIWEVVA